MATNTKTDMPELIENAFYWVLPKRFIKSSPQPDWVVMRWKGALWVSAGEEWENKSHSDIEEVGELIVKTIRATCTLCAPGSTEEDSPGFFIGCTVNDDPDLTGGKGWKCDGRCNLTRTVPPGQQLSPAQKFHYGDLVRVAPGMEHRDETASAVVLGSFRDQHGAGSGERAIRSYTLLLLNKDGTPFDNRSGWYDEDDLKCIGRLSPEEVALLQDRYYTK